MRRYVADVAKYPPLDPDEEARLLQIAAPGPDVPVEAVEALATLTRANLRLVVDIARTYEPTDRPLLKLVQDGNLGLMHGIDSFDPNFGVSFRDHLTASIRAAVESAAETG